MTGRAHGATMERPLALTRDASRNLDRDSEAYQAAADERTSAGAEDVSASGERDPTGAARSPPLAVPVGPGEHAQGRADALVMTHAEPGHVVDGAEALARA